MSLADKAKAIFAKLYPVDTVEVLAAVCPKCDLPETFHRKTLAGQTFWLGCEHAKWLHDAIEDSHAARSSEP